MKSDFYLGDRCLAHSDKALALFRSRSKASAIEKNPLQDRIGENNIFGERHTLKQLFLLQFRCDKAAAFFDLVEHAASKFCRVIFRGVQTSAVIQAAANAYALLELRVIALGVAAA